MRPARPDSFLRSQLCGELRKLAVAGRACDYFLEDELHQGKFVCRGV